MSPPGMPQSPWGGKLGGKLSACGWPLFPSDRPPSRFCVLPELKGVGRKVSSVIPGTEMGVEPGVTFVS